MIRRFDNETQGKTTSDTNSDEHKIVTDLLKDSSITLANQVIMKSRKKNIVTADKLKQIDIPVF